MNMQVAASRSTSTTKLQHPLRQLFWISFLLLCAACFPNALSLSPPFQLQHIDHIVLNYRDDMSAMFDFYTNTLGCTVDSPDDIGRLNGKLTHLRAGSNTMIDLMKQETASEISNASSVDHFCLRIDPFDQENLEEYFAKKGILIQSTGMRKGAQGVGPSIYIKDPEGNTIELKGPPSVVEMDDKGATTTASTDETNRVPVPLTPCTRMCRYNADFFGGQVCIGCYREAFEIGTWGSMSPSQKYIALLDAIDRRDENTASKGSSLALDGSISLDELKRQADYWKELSS
jgi:glyoxylase I family protein